MGLVDFPRPTPPRPGPEAALQGFSIEVMPRTAAKIDDFTALLPAGTRVYIAHIAGTPIDDMLATAARLRADGFDVMPHLPARIIPDAATLSDWLARYADLGIDQALVLAGGVAEPLGAFDNSMQLLDSGAFDRHGFVRLHVAGHPEGNRDIDPDGGDAAVMQALRWKRDFANRSDAQMAIVTQFVFETDPVLAWADRLAVEGIDLPIHLGLAGPAKLQTLIKYAVACGVGPSIRVLQRRARDVTKLLTPFEPTELLRVVAHHKAQRPGSLIERIHLFPLGGLAAAGAYATALCGQPKMKDIS